MADQVGDNIGGDVPSEKFARQSFGKPWRCLKPWPDDCFVQCGGSGVVIGNEKKDSYKTAFFEAFPKSPNTFIRGEGSDIAAAEASAWAKYQKILACDGHDFARRGEESAICKKCGLFVSHHFAPEASCSVCGKEHVNQRGPDKSPMCLKHSIAAWLAPDAMDVAQAQPKEGGLAGFFGGGSLFRFSIQSSRRRQIEAEMGLIDLDAEKDWLILRRATNDFQEDYWRWLFAPVGIDVDRENGGFGIQSVKERLRAALPSMPPMAVHVLATDACDAEGVGETCYRRFLEWKTGRPETTPIAAIRDMVFDAALRAASAETE